MSSASAQAHDASAFVQFGEGEGRVRAGTLGATYSFRTREASDASPWDWYGEASLGRWFVGVDGGGRKQFTEIGLTPAVRYSFGPSANRGVFVEVGLGLHVITPIFEAGDRRFSTTFNFGSHAGLGMRFGETGAHEVVLRVQHYSNGGYKNPNTGEDFVQLRYALHF